MRERPIKERTDRQIQLGRSAVLAAAPDFHLGGDDKHTGLVDTLANLRHWAKSAGLSWYVAMAEADGHYAEETRELQEERRRVQRESQR